MEKETLELTAQRLREQATILCQIKGCTVPRAVMQIVYDLRAAATYLDELAAGQWREK